jgi:general secretion pathway protein F
VPRFEVRLIAAGKARTLLVDASDPDAARAQVSGRGRVLAVRRRPGWSLARTLTHHERNVLFTRLAAMLDSRVGLAEALRRLAASFDGRIRRVAERMADAVEIGDDLATAMERQPADFPQTVVALVRAGGQGVSTPDALRNAAGFEADLLKPTREFRTGLAVSVAHALLGAGTMILTTHVLTPWLLQTELFRDARAKVDVSWIVLSANLSTGVVVLFLGLLAMLTGLTVFGRRLAPAAVDRLLRALPVYRYIALGLEHYITFHKLALLVGSGVGMDKALTLAADSAGGGALGGELRQAARAVVMGKSWTGALRSLHATDRASLAAADSRTEVARTLQALALQHRDLYLFNVGLAQPAMRSIGILFLGLSGMVLFGLTILPVLQIADQLARQTL